MDLKQIITLHLNGYSNRKIANTLGSIVSLQRIENNMDENKIVYHI